MSRPRGYICFNTQEIVYKYYLAELPKLNWTTGLSDENDKLKIVYFNTGKTHGRLEIDFAENSSCKYFIQVDYY